MENDWLKEVATRTNLREGFRAVEEILLCCYFNPGVSTKVLARKVYLPIPVLSAVKKELIKLNIFKQDKGIRCTKEAEVMIETQWGLSGFNAKLYHDILNSEDPMSLLQDVADTLKSVFDSRPEVNVQLDQSHATLETSLRRAILCLRYNVVFNKQILFLGDDDLVSIALSLILKKLYLRNHQTKTVFTVIEIDERLLQYVDSVAESYQLPIEVHKVDLREPLANELLDSFDCFFTDPPYTIPGVKLFLSRGISALRPEAKLPIFFSFGHKPPNFSLEMQRILTDMGLIIAEVIPDFNTYEGAEILGNKSQMFVLRTTDTTVPLIDTVFEEALYTGQISRTVREYRCKNCKYVVSVGHNGVFETIESLKRNGCPRCKQSSKFELIDRVKFENFEG